MRANGYAGAYTWLGNEVVRTVHKTNGSWKTPEGPTPSITAPHRNSRSSSLSSIIASHPKIHVKEVISNFESTCPFDFKKPSTLSYSENINRGLQKHPFKPLDFDFHTSVSLAVLRRAPSSARGISCFFLVIHIASPLLYVEVVYYTTTERKHLNCFYRAINVVSDNFYLSCSQGEYNDSLNSFLLYFLRFMGLIM